MRRAQIVVHVQQRAEIVTHALAVLDGNGVVNRSVRSVGSFRSLRSCWRHPVQNNPQHRRVLVNELLGTRLAGRLGLPTVPAEIVEVSEELIRLTPELAMELPRSRVPCQPGLQFGSRYPVDPRRIALHDLLPEEQLREVENLHDFAGMLVFDKWTCNTNGRQTVFFYESHAMQGPEEWRYKARMIDQGFCFNVGEWNFPDAPRSHPGREK